MAVLSSRIKMYAKKSFLMMIALLCCASLGYASYITEEFDGWVYQNYTWKAAGYNFSAFVVGPKVQIKSELGMVILENGKCEDLENFHFCIDDYEYEYLDKTLAKVYDRFNLVISAKRPNIDITRTVSEDSIIIGQTSTIMTRVVNTGSIDADVYLYDDIPGFEISSVDGCMINGTIISWKGTLGMSKDHTCTYVIKAINKTSQKTFASIRYFDGSSVKTDSSVSKIISVPDYELRLMTALDKKNITVGDEVMLAVMVNNTLPDTSLTLNLLSIKIPRTMTISKTPFGINKFSEYELRKTVNLEPLEGESYNITLKALETGNTSIETRARYTVSQMTRNMERKDPLNVYFDEANVNIIMDNNSLEAGKKEDVRINLNNPSSKSSFYEVKTVIRSDFRELNMEKKYAALNKKNFEELFNGKVTVPSGIDTAFINITVEYQTYYNEKFRLEESRKYSVGAGSGTQESAPTSAQPQEQEKKKARSNNVLKGNITLIAIGAILFAFVALLSQLRPPRHEE